MKYLRENATGYTLIGVGIVAVLAIAFLQGCNLSDMIPVRVPQPVRETVNAPAKVTLTEAPYVRERYVNEFTVGLQQLDDEIERKAALRDIGASLVNTGLEAAEGPLATIPGGGIALLVLGTLGGLFVKKPGTDREIQKAADHAWDEATAKAAELMKGKA